MEKITNILGVIFILMIILFFIALILINIPTDQKEKQKLNAKLSGEEVIDLLKSSSAHLTRSSSLQSGAFTDDSMILFAVDYMQSIGELSTEQIGEYTTVERSHIDEAANEIFDKPIDYSKVTFKFDDTKVDVPFYPISTDLQTFKFKERIYDETEGTYTTYIDCLETTPSNYENIFEDKVTEYDENYVTSTLIFKYKEVDVRRILLAYDVVYK